MATFWDEFRRIKRPHLYKGGSVGWPLQPEKEASEREKIEESTAFGLEIKIEYVIVGKTAFVFILRKEIRVPFCF